MKPMFNIGLAIIVLVFTGSIAFAGDKYTAKRDLPNEASKITEPKFSSTTNRASKPIERIKPEDAIDKALNSPKKLQQQHSMMLSSVNGVTEEVNIEEEKKPVDKVRSNYKKHEKKDTKYHNKRKTHKPKPKLVE